MHILYIKTDLHNQPLIAGGSVSHMLGVLQGFITAGYKVVLATSVDHGDLDGLSFEEKKLLAMPKALKFLRWKINCFLSSFFFLYPTYRLLKYYKPTYIYQRYSPFNFTGVLLQWLTKTPLIIEFNGSEVWANNYWLAKKDSIITQKVMAYCERTIMRSAAKITVTSSPLKDELIAWGVNQKDIAITPNGVNIALFDTKNPSKLPITSVSHDLVVGFVATFRPWHGVNIIEYLIKESAARNLPFHFLLIGDGALLATLKDKLSASESRCVTYTGMVEPFKAAQYLALCDMFICPTQPNEDGTPFFGSPTKLFEYLSLAKPVIASDLFPLNQVISPAHIISCNRSTVLHPQAIGLLVTPTYQKGFLEALLYVHQMDSSERERMGLRARQKVIEEYQWHILVKNMLTTFAQGS